jgi:hypothetical protein
MRSFIISSSHQMKRDETGDTCNKHLPEEKCIQNYGTKTRRDLLEHSRGNDTIILKLILEKYSMVWIGFIWFRIGTSGGLLRAWQ